MIRSWDREGRAITALNRERSARGRIRAQSDEAFVGRLVSLAKTAPRALPGAALAYAHTGKEYVIDADPIVHRQAISNAADAERRARASLPSLMNETNVRRRAEAKQAQQPDSSILGSFQRDFLSPIRRHVVEPVVGAVEQGVQGLMDPTGHEAATGEQAPAPGPLGAVQRGVEGPNRGIKGAIRTAGAAAEDAANLANVEYGTLQNQSFAIADAAGIPYKQPKGVTTTARFPSSPRDLFPMTEASLSDDTGEGFIVRGPARERATATQRETQGSVNGHAGTLGRWTAAQYVDPDSKAYDFLSGTIDFYKAVYGDPTNVALAGVAGVAKGARTFRVAAEGVEEVERAGGIRNALQRFVHGPTTEEYLQSQKWVDTSHAFAREDDFLNLWEKTKGQLGADATARIALSKDPVEITDIAREVLGIKTNQVPRFRSDWRQVLEPPRWMERVPSREVHIEDTDRLVDNVHNAMANLRMPREMRSKRMLEVAAAAGDQGATFNAVYNGAFTDMENWLVSEYKVPRNVATDVTTAITGDLQSVGKFEARMIENKFRPVKVQIGDEVIDVTGPRSLSELTDIIYFPEAGALRRRASMFYRAAGPLAEMEAHGVGLAAYGADMFNRLFKPAALITRLAYPIRVQSELQIRGAVSGLDTLPHHPAGAFAWAMGNSKGAKSYREFWDLVDEEVGTRVGQGISLDVAMEDAKAFAQKTLGLKKSPNTFKNKFQSEGADLGPLHFGGGRGGFDLEGHAFQASGTRRDRFDGGMTPLRSALSSGGGKFNAAELDRVQFANRDLFLATDPVTSYAVANEVGKLSTDPIYRTVAAKLNAGEDLGSVTAWLYQGKGRPLWEKMVASDFETWGEGLTNPEVVDEFVHTIVADGIKNLTGGDARLIEAMATSRWDNQPLFAWDGVGPLPKKNKPNKDFLNHIDEWRMSESAPGQIYGDRAVREEFGGKIIDKPKNLYKKVTGAVFDWMASRPENFFIRHPTMRQFYFQRAKELAPWADEATLTRWVDNARLANMPETYVADLARTTRSKVGTVPGEILNGEAQMWAARKTNDLLWSSADRLQFFDMARFFFPFGDAWGEVVKSWTKLTAANPRVLRRGQQIIQGAQGAGVIYESPETGEQVFKVPFSGWVNEHGVPGLKSAPLVGGMFGGSGLPIEEEIPAQSLNVGMSGLPGFGVATGIAVDKIIPQEPEWDTFRELVLPYGAKDINNPLEMFLPSWLAKYQAAGKLPGFKPTPEQVEQRKKNISYAATYLMSTGAYDHSSDKDMRRLMDDAAEAADILMLTRGTMQFAAPGPPGFRWKVQLTDREMKIDKDGEPVSVERKTGQRLIDLRIASDYARKLNEEFDYESEATLQFLDDMGPNLEMVLQPATRSSIYGLPYGTEAYDWVRKHPDIPKDFPEIYGLFAPDGGDFDMRAYNFAQTHGERETLEGDEFWRLSNHRIAEAMYGMDRDMIGPNPSKQDADYLRFRREQLSKDFADWDHPSIQSTKPFLDGTEGAEQFVQQFRKAVDDPRLSKTPAAQAIAEYLAARDVVRADAGSGFAISNKGAAGRAYLRSLGASLVNDIPEFGPAWDQVFSREGDLDEEGG